jgi:hypothetical protein
MICLVKSQELELEMKVIRLCRVMLILPQIKSLERAKLPDQAVVDAALEYITLSCEFDKIK